MRRSPQVNFRTSKQATGPRAYFPRNHRRGQHPMRPDPAVAGRHPCRESSLGRRSPEKTSIPSGGRERYSRGSCGRALVTKCARICQSLPIPAGVCRVAPLLQRKPLATTFEDAMRLHMALSANSVHIRVNALRVCVCVQKQFYEHTTSVCLPNQLPEHMPLQKTRTVHRPHAQRERHAGILICPKSHEQKYETKARPKLLP